MKLIVLDCDGVLSAGEAQPFDPQLLARLADLNRRARHGEPVPAVTLNTGRPSPYVEAVMQAIDGRLPALYESGAGLYYPQPYRFERAPDFTPAHDAALQAIIRRVNEQFGPEGPVYWQPGKTVCHSLFARPPRTIDEFAPAVREIAADVAADIIVVKQAKLALNIYPKTVNKGSGLRRLAAVTQIALSDMGGVGDTAGDIDFLRLVGSPAAPANATPDVRRVAAYVSPFAGAKGTADILNHWQL